MIVFFSSVSSNTARFVQKLDLPAEQIPLRWTEDAPLVVDREFVLITPTYGANGRDFVPRQVIKFLNNIENRTLIKGVIASGNRNFYDDYAKAGDVVSEKCRVPLLYRFELAGTQDDVTNIQRGLEKFWEIR